MILRFIMCLIIMLAISVLCGCILALFSINLKDESGRSLLYDDPDYYKHEEPAWMRKEDSESKKYYEFSETMAKGFNDGLKDSMQQDAEKEGNDGSV